MDAAKPSGSGIVVGRGFDREFSALNRGSTFVQACRTEIGSTLARCDALTLLDHSTGKNMISIKSSIAGVATICLAAISTGASNAEPAACPSPIPLGLTTALTGNTA